MRRGTNLLARGLALAAAAVVVGLLVGHAGDLHPALDSFSHVRLQLLGVAAFLVPPCLSAGARNAGSILAAVAIGSLAQTAPWLTPPSRVAPDPVAASFAPGVTLLQQNLSYRNANHPAFVRRVTDVNPDVLALQEVHQRHDPLIDLLARDFPHVHRCRGISAVGDVAILSRHPFAPDLRRRCTPGLAIAAVSVDGRALAVGSLHMHWPWPFRQAGHLESLARHVPVIGAPGVLSGDFNAVTWSAATRDLAAMMEGAVVRGIGLTRVDPDIPAALRWMWDIPIDNAIVTNFVEVADARSIALDGSDHDTVILRLRIRLPEAERDLLVLR